MVLETTEATARISTSDLRSEMEFPMVRNREKKYTKECF